MKIKTTEWIVSHWNKQGLHLLSRKINKDTTWALVDGKIELSQKTHDELVKMFPKVKTRCPVCYTINALNWELLSQSNPKDEVKK